MILSIAINGGIVPMLSGRIAKLKPSSTLAITTLAKSLQKKGKDVINFAAGEPDFDTPLPIKEAAKEAIDKGFTKYTPESGIPELRQAISDKFLRDNNLRYEPEEIVVSCGAKHSLYNILQVLCNPGDEVMLVSPYWVSYPEMVRLACAKPVVIKTNQSDGFKLSIKDLKKKITRKTKAFILNSPSNPSGTVYNKIELEGIADVIISRKIYCISDEIYEKLIYDGERHFSIGAFGKDIYDRTITVNGVSKTYSMTGWRIGYLGAPLSIAKAISVLQSHSTSNPASISQKAALKALSLDNEIIENMRREFESRRNYMMGFLDEIRNITYTRPSGAFYIYCNISKTGLAAKEFAKRLLEEKLVAVIPGEDFGSNKFIRLSFTTSLEKIKEGMERVKSWL